MAERGGCADRLLTEDGRTPFTNASGSPVVTGLSKKGSHAGVLLSSDDFGSSIERTATLHPLWRRLSAYQASDAVHLWRTWGVISGCTGDCRLWGDVTAARWR
jgi:hypothetical protein